MQSFRTQWHMPRSLCQPCGRNLLKNTENFFIGHLDDDREVREVTHKRAFRDIAEDVERIKSKGYVRMITACHRFALPVQVRKLEDPRGWGSRASLRDWSRRMAYGKGDFPLSRRRRTSSQTNKSPDDHGSHLELRGSRDHARGRQSRRRLQPLTWARERACRGS